MSPGDILAPIGRLNKLYQAIEHTLKSQEDEIKLLRKDNAEFRKEISNLTQRVAVLEEGRRTVAAEVKLALSEAINTWERQRMEAEIKELKAAQLAQKQITDHPDKD